MSVTPKSIRLGELSLGKNRMKIGPRTKLFWGTSAFEEVGKRRPHKETKKKWSSGSVRGLGGTQKRI